MACEQVAELDELERYDRLAPVEELGGFLARTPAVAVVFPVERGLPGLRCLRNEALDVDDVVHERAVERLDCLLEPGLLAQLADSCLGEGLAILHATCDEMPVRVVLGRPVDDEVLPAPPHHDEHLLCPHAGNITSARAPARAKLPCNSSATRARTMDSPVPPGVPSAPEPSSTM